MAAGVEQKQETGRKRWPGNTYTHKHRKQKIHRGGDDKAGRERQKPRRSLGARNPQAAPYRQGQDFLFVCVWCTPKFHTSFPAPRLLCRLEVVANTYLEHAGICFLNFVLTDCATQSTISHEKANQGKAY
jgi:hypothetical protein